MLLTVAVNLQDFYDFCEKWPLCLLYMAHEKFNRGTKCSVDYVPVAGAVNCFVFFVRLCRRSGKDSVLAVIRNEALKVTISLNPLL